MSARQPDRATPVVAPMLRAAVTRFAAWVGPIRVLPVLFAVAFLWLFTELVAARTAVYYREMTEPPSFRHFDPMDLQRLLVDYLDAHDVGPDTVLVLGDCVAFGHGVTKPFPSMLSFPGYRVLNISMQSFRHDLQLIVIDEAMARGVKHFLVQLHPFEDYKREAEQWRWLKAQRSGRDEKEVPGAERLGAQELIEDARANWPVMALTIKGANDRFYDYREQIPTGTLTTFLRYHILSAWPLYRNRFAVDDWSGLQVSYYTERTRRSDTYVKPHPEEFERQIFREQAEFFSRFIITDRAAYADEMTRYSAPARIAAVLSAAGADAMFVMVPTYVDKIAANSSLPADDLVFASTTMRAIAASRGVRYLDYLTDPELVAEMMYFDNLTARGQQKFGRRLAADLARESFPRQAPLVSR